MNIWLCDVCHERYTREDWTEWNYLCPKCACEGTIHKLDEDISECIRMLWKKGFVTETSCSGHLHLGYFDCYLKFYGLTEGQVEAIEGTLSSLLSIGYAMDFDKEDHVMKRYIEDFKWKTISYVDRVRIRQLTNYQFTQFARQL